jgi:hypothetical protein
VLRVCWLWLLAEKFERLDEALVLASGSFEVFEVEHSSDTVGSAQNPIHHGVGKLSDRHKREASELSLHTLQ